MKRPFRYWVTYLWTWPWDILAWIVVMFVWLVSGTKLHWLGGLWCELKEGSFITRIWRWGGITLGHGGVLAPTLAGGDGIDTPTEFHEHSVHVEQYETAMLLGFITGWLIFGLSVLCGHEEVGGFIGAGVWFVAWPAVYGVFSIQAWFRGENAYRGNSLEEAAYSLTEQWVKKTRGS